MNYLRAVGSFLPKKTLLTSSVAVVISACGGGSGGSDDQNNNASLSGRVADGYLVNANVCLDLNHNKECDDGEPVTISEKGGHFEITDVTQEQIDTYSVVVEIVGGVTTDEDDPSQTLKDYFLSAPPGYDFVSPLSTMVLNELDEHAKDKNFGLKDAELSIKSKLGTDLDLFEDYVAGESSGGDNAEEFARLHRYAQVSANIYAETIENLEIHINIGGSEAQHSELIDLIVQRVISSLGIIGDEVDDSEGFDLSNALDTLSSSLNLDLDQNEFDDFLAVRKAEKELVQADLSLDESIYTLDAYPEFINGEIFDFDFRVSPLLLDHEEDVFGYDQQKSILLGNDGWMEVDALPSIEVDNANSTISFIYEDLPELTIVNQVTKYSIEDLSIASFLGGGEHGIILSDMLTHSDKFSAGAEAFNIKTIEVVDHYILDHYVSSTLSSFTEGCNEFNMQQFGGNCILVYSADDNTSPVTDLDDFISEYEADLDNNDEIIGITYHQGFRDYTLEFVQGGKLNIYHDLFSEKRLVTSASWIRKSINSEDVIIIDGSASAILDFSLWGDLIIFGEHNGFVRSGVLISKSLHIDLGFNTQAAEDITQALNGTN